MWIQRTPEEVTKWQKATERQVRTDGLLLGVFVWIIAVLFVSAGWLFDFQTGMTVQTSYAGNFWRRLPNFALLGSPIILFVLNYYGKQALKKAARETICPQCDTQGDNNAGVECKCGGIFALQKTMKWIEK